MPVKISLSMRGLFGRSRSREERPSRMVLTVTEDTPADMLAGSMELLVQLPRDHNLHTQRVTVQRSTPMMDLLVQIATAHKLAASSYTLQAIGERGLVLPHQPNTPIGALDALQVKLLPKQGTFVPRKAKQANQPFETTFRLQVHLPRNQLYVSRVSPKMNLGDILTEVCREKNLDRNKYELRHPANLEETLDLSLSLQDYHLQEVTLYAKQGRSLGSALSSQDIMALQRQEERRRQQAKQSVFGFMFKKSKESSLSTDSLGGRSVSPARSDETGRSASPLQPPARPQRKRRPAPKPPVPEENGSKEKMIISHSRNSSDSSGYHEASVLSDNPESAGRLPETLPRRSRAPGASEAPRRLAHTSHSSKSLGNLAAASGTLSHAVSNTSLSSAGLRKKRAAPPPPVPRPLSSAISTQALERIVDSEESLTSDMDPSKPPSDIGAPSKASSDIEDRPKANSDIGVTTIAAKASQDVKSFKASSDVATTSKSDLSKDLQCDSKLETEFRPKPGTRSSRKVARSSNLENATPVEENPKVENARVAAAKRVGDAVPLPKPRQISSDCDAPMPPKPPKRRIPPPSPLSRTFHTDSSNLENPPDAPAVANTLESLRASSISNEDDAQRRVNANAVVDADTILVEEPESNSSLDISAENLREVEVLEEIAVKKHGASSVHLVTDEQPCRPRRNNARRVDTAITPCEREKGVDGTRVQGESTTRTVKSDVTSERRSCTVISTIPKCEHLDATTEDDDLRRTMGEISSTFDRAEYPCDSTTSHGPMQSNVEENNNDVGIQSVEMIREGLRNAKRTKMLRSMSKMNDFEINSMKRQRKHLTSNAEDITCALNLSLSSSGSLSSEVFNVEFDDEQGKDRSLVSRDVNGGDSRRGLTGISDDAASPSETDILLQKVSDTLSGTLPVPSSDETTSQPPARPESQLSKAQKVSTDDSIRKTESSIETKTSPKTEPSKDPQKPVDTSEEKTLNDSTPNITLSSQQDTSDYVSAVGEDLSITDWEYQLPAPPSAFRDSNSPVFDGYDTITLRSVEAFKETTPRALDQTDSCAKEAPNSIEKLLNDRLPNQISNREKSEASLQVENEAEPRNPTRESKSSFKQASVDSQKTQPSSGLKKEIISELEIKIGSGSLPQAMNKETEAKRMVDQASTPRIAPTDNTLSNFTITTYTRQKSLNIFEEVDERENVSSVKRPEDRFANSFSTLARNRGTFDGVEQKAGVKEETNWTNGDCKKGEPKIHNQHETLHRWQSCNGSGTERSNVQRSKSCLSAVNGVFHHRDAHGSNEECDSPNFETHAAKKSADVPRSNEKFSQWRENILKRQEEPTKEKQLQSLQVLKSILPQLKSAQQAEENVSKENSDAVLGEMIGSENTSNEHSVESNAVPTRESQGTSDPEESASREKQSKRYTYAGPPAISLGSWSERPTVSVQIKMDTDYKFGSSSSNNGTANNAGKTVVNIGSIKSEKNANTSDSFTKTSEKNSGRKNVDQQEISTSRAPVENKGPDELTKKFITHTTALGFKKSTAGKVSITDAKSRIDDKPVVTGVELKKNSIEANETSNNESVIDTTPLNFKELAKAFGQDVCLRPKPKRLSANRFSDCYNPQSKGIKQIADINNVQNGHGISENVRSQADIVSNNQTILNGNTNSTKAKKFTSIVGIHPSNQNYGQQNGNFAVKNSVNIMKSNPSKLVTKGFKAPIAVSDAKFNGIQIRNGLSPSECSKKVPQPPKPPTMPVITGVTLKSASARPKSMPVQIDPRDVLLESIRNFGGRQNLKSAAERY